MENDNTLSTKLTRIETAVNRIRTKTDTTGDVIEDVATAVEAMTTPTGNINITNTNSTNVASYATAQVVDNSLTADNIKKDVTILGITGSYESVPTTQYVVAESTLFTLSASDWIGDAYSISLTGYTVDTSKFQIGIPTNSSANNTLNIVNAGLSIYDVSTTYIDIRAINVPTSDMQILIFGVEVTS